MDHGEYLADEDMIGIVKERLSRPDAANGYILDGFPRTIPQAQALDGMLHGDPLVIIDLTVPDRELLRRMQERRVCSKCAAIGEPGSSREACERCGGEMITRADDGDEQVRQHRLGVYVRESKPLLDYYRSRPTFRSIDGAKAPEQVAKDLASSIEALVPVPSERRP
jgi:adenylate kinase